MSATDVFFDTNVLLYLLSEDAAKADRVEGLLTEGATISVQILNEIASVASRKLGMKFEEIRDFLASIRAVCIIRPLDVETHEMGLQLAERYRYSVYDSMIVGAALRAGCSTLYSENFQTGQTIERLTIRNPFRD
jgi:predicted nucleic acid-binding protein